jgi:hypothetical protein
MKTIQEGLCSALPQAMEGRGGPEQDGEGLHHVGAILIVTVCCVCLCVFACVCVAAYAIMNYRNKSPLGAFCCLPATLPFLTVSHTYSHPLDNIL